MKLFSLKQILTLFYITTTLCGYKFNFGQDYLDYLEDFQACCDGGDSSPNTCKAKNSILTAGGDWKNQCCYLSYIFDRTLNYQLTFPDNWEEYVKNDNNLYTNYVYCYNILIKTELKNYLLYQLAVHSKNGEVKYDCGDGTISFKASEYNPTDENELSLKEMVDCSLSYKKNDCIEKSKQLKTSTQCCWFTSTIENEEYEDDASSISSCNGLQGFSKEDFKDVQSAMSNLGAPSIKYDFICADKNGKKVTGTYDGTSSTNAVNIETNEQSYSNYLRIGFFGIIFLISIMF